MYTLHGQRLRFSERLKVEREYFPFAPSISRFLNFKLPVESSPQSQPLQDFLL